MVERTTHRNSLAQDGKLSKAVCLMDCMQYTAHMLRDLDSTKVPIKAAMPMSAYSGFGMGCLPKLVTFPFTKPLQQCARRF